MNKANPPVPQSTNSPLAEVHLPGLGRSAPVIFAPSGIHITAEINRLSRRDSVQYLVLAHPDIALTEQTLLPLAEKFLKHPDIAVVTVGSKPFVLAPDYRLALLNLKALSACGGLDEAYQNYGELVDLGWRCWLMGYTIAAVPLPGLLPPHQPAAVLPDIAWRNWLWTVIKNSDDDTFSYELAYGLSTWVSQIYRFAQPDITFRPLPEIPPPSAWRRLKNRLLSRPTIPRLYIAPNNPTPALAEVPRALVGTLVAVNDIAETMPLLMQVRAQIKARRKRSTTEITAKLGADVVELAKTSILNDDLYQNKHDRHHIYD